MFWGSRWISTFLVTLAINHCACNNSRTLKYSTVLWSPGSHAYDYSYRKDPYHNIRIWRHGIGELTNMGVNESYKLGQFLRTRYDGFLRPVKARGEMFVKSTDDDKTVSSALAVLAGLYPVSRYDMWRPGITTWRPTSLRTSSPNDNDVFHLPLTGSDEYTILKDEIFSSDWMQEYEANNSDFFHHASTVTGETWDMSNIYQLADNILTLHSHNLPLLTFWRLPGIIEKLKELNSIYMGSLFADKNGKYTTDVSKRQGGILLNRLVQSMKKKIQHPNSIKRMTGYSVPTTTLVGLLVTLGNYEWIAPSSASSLMFDLYAYNNGTYEIEVSYRNSDGPPNLLRVYDCSKKCPFVRFEEIASTFIAGDSGSGGDSGDDSEDMEDNSFSTCDGLLLGFIATLFIMSFISIGIVLYLLGRPVVPNPNPADFESIE